MNGLIVGGLMWLLLILAWCDSAYAISTIEESIKGAAELLRLPSSVPPNNALHRRQIIVPQPGFGTSSRDEGPDSLEALMTLPQGAAPWAVAISESPDLSTDFLCAGVLVDPNWVLTAAHCTFSVVRRWPNDTQPYVFIGATNLASPGKKASIEQIIVHPKYDAVHLQNDLTLLKIDSKNSSPVATLRLEGPPIGEQAGEIGKILGWGITNNLDVLQHRNALQQLPISVSDNSTCFSTVNYAGLSKSGVFCAKSLAKFHDICFRFGGSPIVLYDKSGKQYLAGIVSWNGVCPDDLKSLNAFVDIQAYVPWIKSVIQDKPR